MSANRVLVVEDDQSFVSLIKLALRDLNVTVEVVTDGPAALKRVAEQKFGIIISDYCLPHNHGVEILKEAKAQNENCKVILISAQDGEQMNAAIAALRPVTFIQKPLSPDELRNIVSESLASNPIGPTEP